MGKALHNRFPPGSIESRDMQHMLHPNANLKLYHQTGPLVQKRARGICLWDNQGRQYLEGLAGLWCTAPGYGEEEWVRVAQDPLRKMSFGPTFVGKTNEPAVLPAEKLKAMAPSDHPLVGDVRGVGLMGGVQLVADKATKAPFEPSRGVGALCTAHAQDGDLLVRPLGDTIAICPPLIITADQIDELFSKLETALDETLTQVSDEVISWRYVRRQRQDKPVCVGEFS